MSNTLKNLELPESKTPVNDNEELIKGLRMFADHLEAHPDIPYLNCNVTRYVYGKEKFLGYARTLGSFKKTFDDKYISLKINFTDRVKVDIYIPREEICKQIVTWECPEDMESLLQGAIEEAK